ncbi:MAG TPA: hypothetical protein VFV85_00600 [Conexibacter sp.]|nr:hypothetical protein [Conexibacter sp.]
MASAFGGRAAAEAPAREMAAGRVQVADARIAAWLLAVPVAAVGAALVWLLGPPLGRAMTPAHAPYAYWAHLDFVLHPEPTEQARYLLSLLVPLLLAGAVAAVVRRGPRVPARAVALGVPLAQALLVVAVAASLVAQYRISYGVLYTEQPGVSFSRHYFTPATLLVAGAFAAAVALLLRSERACARLAALAAESRRRRVLATALAALFTVVWLLHAVNSDRSIADAIEAVRDHVEYQMNETWAVLDGRTPLVNFSSQYGSLWPFAIALSLAVFGKTLLAFTITSTAITAVALLAVFGALRRAARSSLAALALYAPFVATSFFMIAGTATNRYTFGAYFGVFPLRYAGPYLLAWLLARRLDGAARAWPLFAAAGLVVLNNAEFGVPALAATAAALVWTAPDPRPRALLRLAAQALAGLALAYALVALLTLVRAGEVPQLGRLVEFARIFAVGGFGLLPIPGALGLHTAIYLTYVAAIVCATVRALEGAPNRTLTGLLAWAGIFGLGAASYYVGRSHPDSLISTFSAWSLAVALLALDAARRVAASPSRRAGAAPLLAFAALGVCVCSLAQTPTPWGQLRRIASDAPPSVAISPTPYVPDPRTRSFFATLAYGPRDFYYAGRGAPVAIMITGGHRIADAFGVSNVSPYSGLTSTVTKQQLQQVVDALRAAGGNTLIMPQTANEDYELLARQGFEYVTSGGLRRYDGAARPPAEVAVHFPPDTTMADWLYLPATKWVDTTNLRPALLRDAARGRPAVRLRSRPPVTASG